MNITLYHYKKNKRFRGVLYITQMTKVTSEKLMVRLSKMFLGLATLGFIFVFAPPIYSDISYRISHYLSPAQVIPALANVPVVDEFFLEIPRINLVSNIIPNVDATNEGDYLDKLKIGVAHAKGSYFPGDKGPIVLFSHSTDSLAHITQYNAKFYALKDLEIDSPITIHFKGNIYNYKVIGKKIINPTDLGAIQQANAKLILTTCYPPGTDWQRLVIYAS